MTIQTLHWSCMRGYGTRAFEGFSSFWIGYIPVITINSDIWNRLRPKWHTRNGQLYLNHQKQANQVRGRREVTSQNRDEHLGSSKWARLSDIWLVMERYCIFRFLYSTVPEFNSLHVVSGRTVNEVYTHLIPWTSDDNIALSIARPSWTGCKASERTSMTFQEFDCFPCLPR